MTLPLLFATDFHTSKNTRGWEGDRRQETEGRKQEAEGRRREVAGGGLVEQAFPDGVVFAAQQVDEGQ